MIGFKELTYAAGSYLSKHKKLDYDVLFTELNEKMDRNEPFVVGKIGGTELWAIRTVEFGYADQLDAAYDQLCNWSGFFSNSTDIENNLKKFSARMKKTISSVDYLNRWQYPKEEYFVKKYCSDNAKDVDWFGVVYQKRPIGPLLRGKKVLVVTPFDQTVMKQYEKRSLIYSDDYLPEFDLRTYKAVQTLAGNKDSRFIDWFEALDFMISEINNIDFDIALVGAGAYGLPICSAVKESGRSAIHMGADVQLLFGIMGKRWEENAFVQSVRNDYWVYPEKEEIPNNAEKVEGGCYW